MQAIYTPVDARNIEEIAEALEAAEDAEVIALDTETTGLDTFRDVLIVWTIYTGTDKAWMLDREALPYFADLFADKQKRWYFHNYKYDAKILRRYGYEIEGLVYETMVLDWLYDENKTGRKLGDVAHRLLGASKSSFDKTFGKNDDAVGNFLLYLEENDSRALVYATKDAWLTWNIGEELRKRLRDPSERNGYQNLLRLYEEHFAEFIKVLDRMEDRGTYIDTVYLKELGKEMSRELAEVQQRIYTLTDRVINISSTDQLRHFFFDELKLKPTSYTKKKREPSTDAEALQKIASTKGKKKNIVLGRQVAEAVLRYKALAKLKSTYVDGLLTKIHPDTERVHTSLNQHITVTGRLSSSGPNLQNIPARTEEGKKIREAFIPPLGKSLVVGDYEQIEMRVLAHLSQDDNMIDIIRSGKDVHSGTASLMFNVSYDDIITAKKADDRTEEQKMLVEYRRRSKSIGFGLVYGMQAPHLAHDLGITVEEAEEAMAAFFKPFRKIALWIKQTKALCHSELMVKTIIGRPRRLPEIQSTNGRIRSKAERDAVNAPVQGSAADIVRMAMIKCEHDPLLKELDAQMLIQVHDELMFEVPEENAEAALERIRELMEHPGIELLVPLSVDLNIGYSWAEAK